LSWEDAAGRGSGRGGKVVNDLVSVVSALLAHFFQADAESFFVIGVALQDGVFAKVGHENPLLVAEITIMPTRGESYGVFAVWRKETAPIRNRGRRDASRQETAPKTPGKTW